MDACCAAGRVQRAQGLPSAVGRCRRCVQCHRPPYLPCPCTRKPHPGCLSGVRIDASAACRRSMALPDEDDKLIRSLSAEVADFMRSMARCVACRIPQIRSHAHAGDGAPQTFLLTPKLLSGLDFNDHIHIHDIFNGPHVNAISSVRVRIHKTDRPWHAVRHTHLTAHLMPACQTSAMPSVSICSARWLSLQQSLPDIEPIPHNRRHWTCWRAERVLLLADRRQCCGTTHVLQGCFSIVASIQQEKTVARVGQLQHTS